MAMPVISTLKGDAMDILDQFTTDTTGNYTFDAGAVGNVQVTGGQLPDKIPEFGATAPLGRAGQPAELAAVYVLLASPESSYATGQVYGAVGGRGGP